MVRAPRSHRGGRRFKSSIAHHVARPETALFPRPVQASRGGETADALRSGRSVLYGRVGSNPSLGTISFRRLFGSWPSRRVRINLRKRFRVNRPIQVHGTRACSSADRALPCGGRGRGFESRQARHLYQSRIMSTSTFTSELWCIPNRGRLAQMVRAPALHAGGHWFESSTAHQTGQNQEPSYCGSSWPPDSDPTKLCQGQSTVIGPRPLTETVGWTTDLGGLDEEGVDAAQDSGGSDSGSR